MTETLHTPEAQAELPLVEQLRQVDAQITTWSVPTVEQLAEGALMQKNIKHLSEHEYCDAKGTPLNADLVEQVATKLDSKTWLLEDETALEAEKVLDAESAHELSDMSKKQLRDFGHATMPKGSKLDEVFTAYKQNVESRLELSSALSDIMTEQDKAKMAADTQDLPKPGELGKEADRLMAKLQALKPEEAPKHQGKKQAKEPVVDSTTTDFGAIPANRVIDEENGSDWKVTRKSRMDGTPIPNAEAQSPIVDNDLRGSRERKTARAPIVSNNLRGGEKRHNEKAVAMRNHELNTNQYDEEGTLIISAAEKANMRQQDQDLAALIRMNQWGPATYTDTNKQPVVEGDQGLGTEWGETEYYGYESTVNRVKRKFAEAKAALTNLMYDAKDQIMGKEHRERNIIGGVMGAIAVGTLIYFESKGHDTGVSRRGGGGGSSTNTLEQGQHLNGVEIHQPVIHEFTLKSGNNVWDKVNEYATQHGHHLSEEQKHFITGKVLHANHETWNMARENPIGYKFRFSDIQFDDWLKQSVKESAKEAKRRKGVA